MKNGKGVGPDQIPAEVWKSLGEEGIRLLTEFLNMVMKEEIIPNEWRDSFMGSALSPYLFILLMDVLVEEVTKEAPWSMLFADDIILVSESHEELQERLELWRGLLEDYGLKVSRQKTEYLECNVAQGGNLFMQDHKLPKVDAFKYHGSYMIYPETHSAETG
ncbi:hypothetical protein Pcinc_023496 [Petrolisthes cinctipes]|uniref:Reverse transcriptase domain-containing protein n=1 Tax=Petrolisthes cinctipes TaxID=88211 RepID=A0AAE1FD44_PETCI|nr:hypothetical protein Pcinc_023496 [Petrolisthes cinctipes]